jgi:hypothetical protein
MSYTTKLIARSGYSGIGDTHTCGGTQEWDPRCEFNGNKGQCVPRGSVGRAAGCNYTTSDSAGSPSTISQIGGAAVNLLSGVLNSYATAAGTKPPTTIVNGGGGGTPPWLVPAAIGGVGLIAVIMLTRPRSNPARRRRRR